MCVCVCVSSSWPKIVCLRTSIYGPLNLCLDLLPTTHLPHVQQRGSTAQAFATQGNTHQVKRALLSLVGILVPKIKDLPSPSFAAKMEPLVLLVFFPMFYCHFGPSLRPNSVMRPRVVLLFFLSFHLSLSTPKMALSHARNTTF